MGGLNDEGSRWNYTAATNTIISSAELIVDPAEEAQAAGELWTCAALGGAARVEALRSLFVFLRAKGMVLTIITKGYVGAVRKILLAEGLLEYFDTVYGNIGKAYGEN